MYGSPQSSSIDLANISCESCGVYDATLRFSSHPTVISFLIAASESAPSGIWCARCRGIQSAKAAAVTVIAGWWSVPGVRATIPALKANLNDGEQNATANAQLLRGLARTEYDNGNPEFAAMFAQAANDVQPQRENTRLMDDLRRAGHRPVIPPSPWRYAPIVPVILVGVFALFGASRLISRREPEAAVATARSSTSASSGSSGSNFAALTAAKQQSHPKLNPNATADELEKLLTPDSDDNTVRSYIRARLMELKSELRPAIERGESLIIFQTKIDALGQQPAVTKYMSTRPAVRAAYDSLSSSINDAMRYYHGGAPVDAISRTAGESLNVTYNLAYDAIQAESRGHTGESGMLVTEVQNRTDSLDLMRADLRVRGAVIGNVGKALDTFLNAIS